MSTLHMIYTNSEFKSMINFEIEVDLSYEQAYSAYGVTEYIPQLLKRAKPIIQTFGNAIKFPNELAMYMSDIELDAFLLALHKDVDELIENHIFVRVPTKHATSFQRIEDQTFWRLNGIGMFDVVLANINKEKRVFINIAAFDELRDNYVTYSMSKSHA